jgi:predicted signal transduction protein with EAL and GGDEF domain
VAERMLNSVRTTDTVVRLGGDEFVIVLVDHPDSVARVTAILEETRAAIARPIVIDNQTLRVTCSMGLATFPNDGRDAETLIRNADAAMYQAKTAGRDNFQYFTEAMNAEAHERLSLQLELREAVAGEQFILHYQPEVDLKSGQVFAVEALVRWNHPVRGLLSPDRFIGLAEDSGLIVPIGDWVLRTACRQNREWQDAGLPPIRVCVNVSARQFRDKTWIDRVRAALDDARLEPKYLELELTESMIMQDINAAVAVMHRLQKIGVQFAIDDFGTGYSSLSALKNFPVGRLKIDRSFVKNLPADGEDRGIASAVISLGQKLNMKVIAEGVETEAQMAFLTKNRCDEIQGYRFSRPVEASAIATLMGKQRDQNAAAARR